MLSAVRYMGLAILFFVSPALAAVDGDSSTGCDLRNFLEGYYIADNRRVFDDEKFVAIVHKLDTPLYKDATGETRSDKTLRFSQRVGIADPGEGASRLKIKDVGGQPLGWVNRDAILCKIYPISDRDTGLYRRAVVRTDTAERGQAQIKKVYHSPDRRCEGGPNSCVEVSRFQWYFIYAEENGHYLISEAANLGSASTRLLGWLPVGDAYNWNTALGVRPAEELATRRATPQQPNKEDFICAYRRREDLSGRSNCNEILGGRRWFGLNVRMAVLKEENQAYEVIFSNAGTAGRDVVAPVIEGLKKLDVFFVIDGTKSMQPAIDGVKGLVDRLTTQFKGKLSQGGVIRFGFKVYRDSIPGTGDGVANSERLELRSSECGASNEQEFRRAFESVKAFEPAGDDDFPENSFAGMVQASADLAPCSDHAKLVFVIGDHGYDGAKQQKRGYTRWTEAQVAERFKKGTRFKVPPIVVFIQTPSEEDRTPAVAKKNYSLAYKAYEDQGKAILQAIYSGTGITDPAQYFIQMPPGNITESVIQRVSAQVDTYLQPEVISQIASRLQAGQSLVETIESLRANSQLNIPIRYLQFVEEALCQRLGPQCRQKVFEGVNRAYVPVSNDLVPEVLLARDQLDKWVKILDVFKTFATRTRGREGRDLLVSTLLASLGSALQMDFENNQVPLGKRIQFVAGIPHGVQSKLMQYSSEDLRDSTKVPACEVDYLAQYGAKKHDVLNIVFGSEGKLMAAFEEARWPEGQCPNLSEKGKNIPFIEGAVRPRSLNSGREETNYSIMHKRGNEFFFWIPVRYLP
ncbi:MAG: hypothetical protein GHHEDOFH_00860 [Pseudorhodoplanes sp.]|nr:hypothetical protein [Pseudorhodoplanes sp.]